MTPCPIDIDIKTTYIPEQSRPVKGRFVYAYTITIKNRGTEPARLISRHWIVRDAHNQKQEISGMGVVGEQPRILPGDEYTYTSGVILETQSGTMEGSYQMQTDDGELFDAPIPLFALIPPHAIH